MFGNEVSILLTYGLVVGATIILQTTGLLNQLGIGYILSSRDEHRTATGIAARLERAQANSVVALALFAPPILVLAINDNFSARTLEAAQVFLIARLIYLPAYGLGITGLRTLVWLGGFAATMILYFLAI